MFWLQHDTERTLFILIASVYCILATHEEDSSHSTIPTQPTTVRDEPQSPSGAGDAFHDIRERGKLFNDSIPAFLERLLNDSRKFYYWNPSDWSANDKTIFVQMMASFFKGEKTHFKNLSIYERGNGDQRGEWIEYPVIHLDFAALELEENRTVDNFKSRLRSKLLLIANVQYSLKYTEDDFGFMNMIFRLATQRRVPVVILIDNYSCVFRDIDSPVDNIHNLMIREYLEDVLMKSIKSYAMHLKIVFVTG